MNPEKYNQQLFGILSSYRAKPMNRIENHLLRHVDEPLHQEVRETLPKHLSTLVNDNIIDHTEKGYKLNPFHPLHSQVVPVIEQDHLTAGFAGPATSNFRLELCYMPGVGRMSQKSYETLMRRRRSQEGSSGMTTETPKKGRGRSRSRSTTHKAGRGRSRSASRGATAGRRGRAPGR